MFRYVPLRGAVLLVLVMGCLNGSVTPLAAQLRNPSAAALGMAGNFAGAARGPSAVYWNPAGLALKGTERFSLFVSPLVGAAMLAPFSPGELARAQGNFLDEAAKAEWLARIRGAGGLSGRITGSTTYLAGNAGRVGLMVSTAVFGETVLSPGGAELMLYGNVGPDGMPRVMELQGSTFELGVTSTAAVAVGQPIVIGGETLALGATLKYTVGHLLYAGRDEEARLEADPLRAHLRFPLVQTAKSRTDRAGGLLRNNGAGLGLDLGIGWEAEQVAVSAVARNVINGFAWDPERLVYRPGVVLLERGRSEIEFGERSLSTAPPDLRDWVARLKPPRSFAFGIASRPRANLLLVTDYQVEPPHREGAMSWWRFGTGLEFRPRPWLPLRTGIAWHAGGVEYAGGLGVRRGPIDLAMGAGLRRGIGGIGTTAALQVGFNPLPPPGSALR